MLVPIEARLLSGLGHFGHGGGLRHGSALGFRIVGILLAFTACLILAAFGKTLVGDWAARQTGNDDSRVAAGWVTFVVLLVALGWLVTRVT